MTVFVACVAQPRLPRFKASTTLRRNGTIVGVFSAHDTSPNVAVEVQRACELHAAEAGGECSDTVLSILRFRARDPPRDNMIEFEFVRPETDM
jgi:hypothetical protein